ncbi:hypothetical protein HPB48_020036 [Haemaphysalis longicornis]|uniref:TCTP domain-containing protein n=1 Tax=Haemaphysalis longicornis TaxID=44386 RepID=A0A9J6G9N9_HAELO|nr:hypothetical protein HPB48_020036 [Haemaphysalis longicornis]
MSAEQIEDAKAKLTTAVKKVLPKIEDCQFYLGESCNADGIVFLLEYRKKPGGGETAVIKFFKHGLDEEKMPRIPTNHVGGNESQGASVGVVYDVDVSIPDADLPILIKPATEGATIKQVTRLGKSRCVKLAFQGDCIPAHVKFGLSCRNHYSATNA